MLISVQSATLIAVLLICATFCHAQPTTKPAEPGYVVTPMRIAEMKGAVNYLYNEAETTVPGIKETVDKLMPPVDRAMQAGKFQRAGEFVFVYQGITDDMTKMVKMQLGVPVAADVKAFDGFKVRPLAPLRAATVVYSGPISKFPSIFPTIYRDLFAAGYTPNGEVRESYVYWEEPESPNNVIIVQVGVN